MSSKNAEPLSASCNVAKVLIREDFPAPLGPNKPNIPFESSMLMSSNALTPLAYVFESLLIFNVAIAIRI